MPIPPANLAAFAQKKRPNAYDDGAVDEIDVEEMEASDDLDEGDDLENEDVEEEETEEEGEESDLDLDALIDLVEGGDGDPALMSLAQGVNEENNPPAWVMDEDIWEEAKDAVEDRWDEMAEPYAVVTHVYKAMGGEVGE